MGISGCFLSSSGVNVFVQFGHVFRHTYITYFFVFLYIRSMISFSLFYETSPYWFGEVFMNISLIIKSNAIYTPRIVLYL